MSVDQTGIVFMCTPYVYWKIASQNATSVFKVTPPLSEAG